LGFFPSEAVPKRYDLVVKVPRARPYGRRSEEVDLDWNRHFIWFQAGPHPLGDDHVGLLERIELWMLRVHRPLDRLPEGCNQAGEEALTELSGFGSIQPKRESARRIYMTTGRISLYNDFTASWRRAFQEVVSRIVEVEATRLGQSFRRCDDCLSGREGTECLADTGSQALTYWRT
jgi:hypothetical protein